MDFSDGEILIVGDCLDFFNGEIQTGLKIRISPSEKSIYAHIYAHVRCIQLCACLQADMDLSDGETQVFDTSLDFSVGEIQTGANHFDFFNGEICILGDCLDFSNGEIQTGAKNRNPYIYAHMHIFGLSKCVYVCKHNWISLM